MLSSNRKSPTTWSSSPVLDQAGNRRRRLWRSAAAAGSAAALTVGVTTAVPAEASVDMAPHSAPSVRNLPSAQINASPTTCTISPILVSSCGIWWGASVPAKSKNRTQSLKDFEALTRNGSAIYHVYRKLGDQFPNAEEIAIARQPGSHRYLFFDYLPEGGRTWAQVASGASDAQIDKEAAYIKANYKDKFFMSIHHEPEDEVQESANSGRTAKDFAAMYRHVVTRFRAQGVGNIVFVWNVMGAPVYSTKPWFSDLYPGDQYVDWVASDPYGCVSAKECDSFTNTVNRFYGKSSGWSGFHAWAAKYHASKPMMLAEWGVFGNVSPSSATRTRFLNTIPGDLKSLPNVKAMVYFNSPSPRGDVFFAPGTEDLKAFQRVSSSSEFLHSAP